MNLPDELIKLAPSIPANAFKVAVICCSLPNGWNIRAVDIASRCGINEKTCRDAIKLLKNIGLIISFNGVTTVNITGKTVNFTENSCDEDGKNYRQTVNITDERENLPAHEAVIFTDEREDLPESGKSYRQTGKFTDEREILPTTETVEFTGKTVEFTEERENLPENGKIYRLLTTKQLNNKQQQRMREENFSLSERNAELLAESVDFSQPMESSLREKVSRILWCDSLRRDVIDRATAGVLARLPGFTKENLHRISKEAKKSSQPGWKTVNIRIMQLFESLSPKWDYPPTRTGIEPQPEPIRRIAAVETSDTVHELEDDDDQTLILTAKRAGVTPEEPLEASARKLVAKCGIKKDEAMGNALWIRRKIREETA